MSAVAELDRQASPGSTSVGSNVSDTKLAESRPEPNEGQMLDVLYEILATGPAPRSRLTRELVERFLHEHARAKKPTREMVRFFEEYGLPLKSEEYGTDPELVELANGLQRERSSLVPGFGLAEPEEPTTLPPATVEAIRRETTPAPEPDAVSTGRHAPVVVAPIKSGMHWGVWAAVATIVLALGGGLAFSYLRSGELEQKLDQARMQQRSTDAALTKLEQRAESLQGALQQSDQDRRAQQTRLQEELAAQAKQRAIEEAAVEKVLGPRYPKLRAKLANEANKPAP